MLINLKQNNLENTMREIANIKIFNQLSKILYNFFEHYILTELKNNNYEIKFIDTFKKITNKNKYL